VFLVNVINFTLIQAEQESSFTYNNPNIYITTNTTQNNPSSYWSFWDYLKSLVFPSQVYDSLKELSTIIASFFIFLYYITVAYSVVFFLIKVLPFIGTG